MSNNVRDKSEWYWRSWVLAAVQVIKGQGEQEAGEGSAGRQVRPPPRLLAEAFSEQVKARAVRENTELHSRELSSLPESRKKKTKNKPKSTHPGLEWTKHFLEEEETPPVPKPTVPGRPPPMGHQQSTLLTARAPRQAVTPDDRLRTSPKSLHTSPLN